MQAPVDSSRLCLLPGFFEEIKPAQGVIRQNSGRVERIEFPRPNAGHSAAMILTILRLLSLISATLRLRSDLAIENLALRQQLAVLN